MIEWPRVRQLERPGLAMNGGGGPSLREVNKWKKNTEHSITCGAKKATPRAIHSGSRR